MKVFWFFAPGIRFTKKNSWRAGLTGRGRPGGRAPKEDSASF
jgi:hypothetical protein